MIDTVLIVIAGLAMLVSFFNTTFVDPDKNSFGYITKIGWLAFGLIICAFILLIVKQCNDTVRYKEFKHVKVQLEEAQVELNKRALAIDLLQKESNCDTLRNMCLGKKNILNTKAIDKDLNGDCK